MKRVVIIFCFVSLFFPFLLPSGVFAQAELPAPTINVAPDLYYPLDDVLFIEGRAIPNQTIQVRFESSGQKPINANVKSDAHGEWVFAQKIFLEAGHWEIRAKVIASSGDVSPWSNPRVMKSVVTGFSIGSITIKYAPIITIIIIALIASLVLLMYSMFRVGMTKRLEQERETHDRSTVFEKALHDKEREMEKERAMLAKADELTKELRERERAITEIEVEKKFSDIKQNVLRELEHLEKKLASNGSLSAEEKEHHENLLRQFHDTEESIEKTLKNIK